MPIQHAEKPPAASLTPITIATRIHLIRGLRVMLDSDLAELYGVQTKVLNQAVSRNATRFPPDFAFRLNAAEVTHLRSQLVTSSLHGGSRHAGFRVAGPRGSNTGTLPRIFGPRRAVRRPGRPVGVDRSRRKGIFIIPFW